MPTFCSRRANIEREREKRIYAWWSPWVHKRLFNQDSRRSPLQKINCSVWPVKLFNSFLPLISARAGVIISFREMTLTFFPIQLRGDSSYYISGSMTVVAHWLDANLKSIPLRRKQLHLYFVLNSSGPFPRSLTKSKYIFSASADKKLSDRKLIFYLWSTEDFGGGLRGAFVTHVTVCLHGKILKRIEKVCPGRPGALVVICLVFFGQCLSGGL